MKKKSLFIWLIILGICIVLGGVYCFFGGDKYNHVEYYNNGKIREKGNIVEGKKNGKWIEYYQDGQIRSEGYYSDGLEDGDWVTYYRNGQIKSIGKYDKKYVNYKFHEEHGGQVGKWIDYYENGNISSVLNYEKGYIIDIVLYYENGNINSIDHYSYEEYGGGRRWGKDGEHEDYYENGNLKTKGQYSSGRKIGTRYYYDENGKYLSSEAGQYGD